MCGFALIFPCRLLFHSKQSLITPQFHFAELMQSETLFSGFLCRFWTWCLCNVTSGSDF